MKLNPLFLIDGYKTSHRKMYPEGTEFIYSNFTPRMSRIEGIDKVVIFGIQYLIMEYFIDLWNKEFFEKPKGMVVKEYTRIMRNYLGPEATSEHIEQLHDLGFLPIKIKALKEGSLCPIGVPCLTIINTHKDFGWLTNYLETLISNIIWKPITSATTAFQVRKTFEEFAEKTGYDKNIIQFQGHDFSMRGMTGLEDAILSDGGHALSFTGSDTVPVINFFETYYDVNSDEELVICTVPASEHSCMCMGSKEGELATFKRIITETYPVGIVSVVMDTYDFFHVMTDFIPKLKKEIMSREGRVVIRGDSGNPVDIICGTSDKYTDISEYFSEVEEVLPEYFEELLLDEVREYTPHGEPGPIEWQSDYKIRGEYYRATIHDIPWNRHDKHYYYIDTDMGEPEITVNKIELSPEEKGAYELLWEIFGGTINEKGYKELDPHVGFIYGDSITLDRQKQILEKLERKGFAASNLVLGIGSFTYEYVTRDTFGMAMKATNAIVDGASIEIFKDPKTDSGFKKSAKGLLMVYRDETGILKLKDQCTPEEEASGELRVVFEDGKLYNETTLKEIRSFLLENLK